MARKVENAGPPETVSAVDDTKHRAARQKRAWTRALAFAKRVRSRKSTARLQTGAATKRPAGADPDGLQEVFDDDDLEVLKSFKAVKFVRVKCRSRH